MVEIITGVEQASFSVPIEYWLIAAAFSTGIIVGVIFLRYFKRK